MSATIAAHCHKSSVSDELIKSESIERILRITNACLNASQVTLFLGDEQAQRFMSMPHLAQDLPASLSTFIEYTKQTDAPLIINDTISDPIAIKLTSVVERPNIRFFAAVPLHNSHGECIGCLSISDQQPRELTAAEIDSLIDLASTLTTLLAPKISNDAIDSQQLAQMSQQLRSNNQLSKLRNHTLELVAQGKPIMTVLRSIITGVEQEFPKMLCSILQLNQQKTHFCNGIAPSLPDFYNDAVDGLAIGDNVGSCGTAAFRAQRFVVSDIASHPYWVGATPLTKRANLGACWSQPILSVHGDVLGTFAIYHQKITVPSELEFRLIEQSAHLASIAIERDQANKLIWHQANYDALTGLPNRQLCREHLATAMVNAKRSQQQVAVMFIDLDRFKEVNDTLGHAEGDALLIESAKRIQLSVRPVDTVARFGGDEFIVILAELNNCAEIERVAQQIMVQLTLPFSLGQDIVHISASIGISLYPNDADNIECLMKNSDQAMYHAKGLGRDCYHFFTYNMLKASRARMSLINDLHQALANDEFVLYYQPIIDLHSGQINKAEALIRWFHPQRGLVNPDEFIGLAEETGLIIPIGEWVINQALSQAAHWKKQLGHSFQISVNTSPVQYNNTKPAQRWLDVLTEPGVDHSSIIIEITENILMDSQADIIDILNNLRTLGIEIAIDDFGTGYSSLAYIKKFNIDYLKIDRQFVHSMTSENDDFVLCDTIVTMAKKLGTRVVAEGIENKQQLMLLQEMGCEFGQGFHVAKPLTCADFELQFILNGRDEA
ncbi:MAG: EAL domain-containing protein [Gammaproteobacteria bacterium]|nr:EAL domain-containing protein [Gammaproteobacteria bacterium]